MFDATSFDTISFDETSFDFGDGVVVVVEPEPEEEAEALSHSIGDWPHDLAPYRWEFYLQPNTRKHESPVVRTRQVLIGQGQRWIATGSWKFVTINAAGRRKAQRFEALLDRMAGQVNTVNIFDFGSCGGPLGPMIDLSSIGLTQFVDDESPENLTPFTDDDSPPSITYFTGGEAGLTIYGNWSVGANTVLLHGFPQNTTQLYAGDQIEISGFLYRLTQDATADGLNRAVLYLNRPLVAAVAHGATPVFTRPRTPMQLLDDDQSRRAMEATSRAREYTVSFLECFF